MTALINQQDALFTIIYKIFNLTKAIVKHGQEIKNNCERKVLLKHVIRALAFISSTIFSIICSVYAAIIQPYAIFFKITGYLMILSKAQFYIFKFGALNMLGVLMASSIGSLAMINTCATIKGAIKNSKDQLNNCNLPDGMQEQKRKTLINKLESQNYQICFYQLLYTIAFAIILLNILKFFHSIWAIALGSKSDIYKFFEFKQGFNLFSMTITTMVTITTMMKKIANVFMLTIPSTLVLSFVFIFLPSVALIKTSCYTSKKGGRQFYSLIKKFDEWINRKLLPKKVPKAITQDVYGIKRSTYAAIFVISSALLALTKAINTTLSCLLVAIGLIFAHKEQLNIKQLEPNSSNETSCSDDAIMIAKNLSIAGTTISVLKEVSNCIGSKLHHSAIADAWIKMPMSIAVNLYAFSVAPQVQAITIAGLLIGFIAEVVPTIIDALNTIVEIDNAIVDTATATVPKEPHHR